MKALLALVPLLMLGASPPHFDRASVPGSPVLQVECDEGAGTAFRAGPQTILSVNHVTSLGRCTIDGEPINVSYHGGDFSIITPSNISDRWLKVDCGGFVVGHKYVAEGYARGEDKIVPVDLEATGVKSGQFAILKGTWTVIPGMSGGPVTDAETGKVVGTVNIYNFPEGISGSVPLSDTPICENKQGRKA